MHLALETSSSCLYIGCRRDAFDEVTLTANNIQSILTVDSKSLDDASDRTKNELAVSAKHFQGSKLNCKYVFALDSEEFNLLAIIPECLDFLEHSLSGSNNVLVHCFAGVSRSAAVVIAYMMNSRKQSYEDAFQHLKSAKHDACPNDNFARQLLLYEKLGCPVSLESQAYRLFLAKFKMEGSTQFIDEHFLASVDTLSSVANVQPIIKCRKCRKAIVKPTNSLPPHNASQLKSTTVNSNSTCTSVFLIEPEEWMLKDVNGCVEGKLLCPFCGCKVGYFNWSGSTCSCGEWVTPSFQFHCNRIDVERRR